MDSSSNFVRPPGSSIVAGPQNRKKVALVACPWVFYERVEFISQQLGLGYIAAYAEECGHDVSPIIDPMVEGGFRVKSEIVTRHQVAFRFGHNDEWIVDRIPKDVDVIGVNAPFTDSRVVLYPLVRKIKNAYADAIVVIGGVLATTLPRQVIEETGADIVVKGEGEIAFARILNGEPIENIPGLVVKRSSGEIIESELRSEQLLSIDSIPPPAYHLRPMAEYVKWSPRGDRVDRTLSIISSRGCPFTCEFCSIPEKGQRWRPFTPERVVQEIKSAIDRWGVNHIEFEDDNFTLQEPRALQVLTYIRELRQSGYEMTCSFPNGIMIDRMTEDLATLLYQAGSDIIYLPVESGDTRVLVSMDKPHAEKHLANTLQVAKWCVDAGLRVSCFFIVAYPGGRVNKRFNMEKNRSLLDPYQQYLMTEGDDIFMIGEDEASFSNTLEFCGELVQLGVHGITPLIATPYPGTEMYEVSEHLGWLKYEDDPGILTTMSYGSPNPGLVQLETPWCTQSEAIERWKEMMNTFDTFHNVRKEETRELLSGDELRNV